MVLLTVINVSSSNAGEWLVRAGANQSISYDDNVTMREEAEDSFVYRVKPDVSFSHKTDVSNLSATASYEYQKFFNISRFKNKNNQHYGINGEYFTERTVWGLTSSYNIAPARDTAEDNDGNFETDAERKNFSVSPSISYQITETDSLLLSAGYAQIDHSVSGDDYESCLTNSKNLLETNDLTKIDESRCDFYDYKDKNISLSWSRQWTQLFLSSFDITYSNFESETKNVKSEKDYGLLNKKNEQIDSDTIELNVSARYNFLETLEVYGGGGYRTTKTERTVEYNEPIDDELRSNLPKDDDWEAGWLLDIGAIYRGENLETDFKVSHSQVPSTRGSLEDQTEVSLDLNYDITARLKAELMASYRFREARKGSSSRTNYLFNPSVSWLLAPEWTVAMSYRYRHQTRPIGSEEEKADSNVYMLSLNYRWQGLSIAR